jgi:hypothetical protein
MRIHIEGDTYISGDRLGFYVEKSVVKTVKYKKTGNTDIKEVFETIGNYANLTQCLSALVRFKVSESTAETLAELLHEIRLYRLFIQSKTEGVV